MQKQSTKKKTKSQKRFYEPQQEDSQYLSGFQNNFYYVKDIIKQRLYRGRLQYFVSWQGWPSKYNSWVYGETIMPFEDFLRSNESTEPTNICSQQQKERLGETEQKNKLQCEVTIAEESQKLEKSQSNKIMVNNSENIDKSKKKLRRSQTKKNIIHVDSSQSDNYLVQTKVEVDYTSLVLEKFKQPETQKQKQSNSMINIERLPRNKKKTKKDIKQAKKKKKIRKSVQATLFPSQNEIETKKQNIQNVEQKNQEQKDEREQQKQQIKILKQIQRLEHNIDGLNMSSSDINNLRTSSSFMIQNIIDTNKSAIMSNCRVETQDIEDKKKQEQQQQQKQKQKQKQEQEQGLKLLQKQMVEQIEKQKGQQLQKISPTLQKNKPQNKTIQKNKQTIGNQKNTNKQYIINLGTDSDDGQISKLSFDSLDDFSMVSSVSKPNKKKQYPRADIKITKFFNRKNKKKNITPIVKILNSNKKDKNLKQAQNINKIYEQEVNKQKGNQKEKIVEKFDIKDIESKKSISGDFIITKATDFNPSQLPEKIIKNQQDGQQKNQKDNVCVENQSLLLPNNCIQEQKERKKSQKSPVNQQETQSISFDKCLSKLSDTNLLQNSIQSQSALYPIEEQSIRLAKKQIIKDLINKSGEGHRLQCTFDNYSLLLNQTQITPKKAEEDEKLIKQYQEIISQSRQQNMSEKKTQINSQMNEELGRNTYQEIQKCRQDNCQNVDSVKKKSVYAKNMKKILEQESPKIRTQIPLASIEYSANPQSQIFSRNYYFNDQYMSLYSEESLSKSQK